MKLPCPPPLLSTRREGWLTHEPFMHGETFNDSALRSCAQPTTDSTRTPPPDMRASGSPKELCQQQYALSRCCRLTLLHRFFTLGLREGNKQEAVFHYHGNTPKCLQSPGRLWLHVVVKLLRLLRCGRSNRSSQTAYNGRYNKQIST